jgi:hypothetical protein
MATAKKTPTAHDIAGQLEDVHDQCIRALDMASGHAPGSAKHLQFQEKYERHSKKFYDLIAALKFLTKPE